MPPANTAAVSGQAISSTAFNTLETDIGTEITNSVDRGGRSAMTAALPMGANKITGMADPTVATDAATKNYVDNTASFSTGDVKLTLKTAADAGWVMATNNTLGNLSIGNAGSGATGRANVDCLALFTLVFNNLSDANAPIFTSGGAATTRAAQTNVSTAWAALCRLQIGFFADRAIGVAGNPADLPTNRVLGDHPGAETATILTANLPAYTPAGSIAVGALGGTTPNVITTPGGNVGVGGTATGGALETLATAIGGAGVFGFTGTAQGGTSTPVSIIPPSTFLFAMVKL